MKAKILSWLTAFGLLVIVAVSSSLLTVWLLKHKHSDPTHDFHAWIHEELGLTDEQEKRLEPSELRYEEAKRHLTEVIRLANRELAQAIAEDRENSPRVQAAVRRIHEAMGELQQATLQHIFEMKEVLEPEQYERLIELTRDALERQGGKQ